VSEMEETGQPTQVQKTVADDILDRAFEEFQKGHAKTFESLSPEGREYVRQMLPRILSGDANLMDALYGVDYEHKRVDPETFFSHPDYMGHFKDQIYEAWWPHLMRICDPMKSVYEVVLTGSIGSGKSTVGTGLVLSYYLHRILCLKDPAAFFGLGKGSRVVFGVYSLDLQSAEDVGFYILRDQMLADSPFFNSLYPRSPHGTDEIKFSKGVLVKIGSSGLHAAGKNLFAIVIDEMNLMRRGESTANKAFSLANDVIRRLESRFLQSGGDIPGVAVFIGSAGSESDFIERRIRMTKGMDHRYVVRCAIWDFVRKDKEGNSRYGGEKFRVQIGSKYHKSKVLDHVVYEGGEWLVSPLQEAPDEDCGMVEVPVEHYSSFSVDPDGSLADFAGVSTKSFMKLFTNRERLLEAADENLPNPFGQETIQAYLFGPTELAHEYDQQKVCKVCSSRYRPIRHPEAPRYIHIDLAKKWDRAGIAMVHPSSHFLARQDIGEEIQTYDIGKELEVDFALGVEAGPKKEAIDFANIRRLILFIRDCGFWIRLVTLDSWQSEDTRQRLLEAGVETEIFSVDKDTRPYLIFRNAVNAGKVKWPQSELLFEELSELDYDVFLDKVDHPDGGTKDVADAVAAASYRCLVDKVMPSEVRSVADRGHKLNKYLARLKDLEGKK